MYQFFNDSIAATPAKIHLSEVFSVGISMYITKLLEWPVVDSIPCLDVVLYIGHS